MRYIFEFTKIGKRSFLKIDKKIRDRIEVKLRFFIQQLNPLVYAVKLEGQENKYRFRIGDYRVVFSKKENGELIILLILKAGHRKDVYE